MSDVTEILSQIEQGDPSATEQLLPLVYDELRKLAAARLRREEAGQTLQATALVHEAYVRLVDTEHQQKWNSRGHFFAAAAEAMRRILVESARKKARLKRGGDLQRIEFDVAQWEMGVPPDKLLAIDEALDRLSREDAAAADIVNLCYFAGFSIEEAAASLGISRATAYRHWRYAKAWLQCELGPE